MKTEIVKSKFQSALCEFEINGGVLIALSGGADSVCLLDLFAKAQASSAFPYKVAAAHLNHNLRGEESDRDELFCRRLCEEYSIELFVGSEDVNSLAKKIGKGVEEAARSARYRFLNETASNNGLSYIATAHNQGDLCETVILNLARGAGLDGMCSIPKRRNNIIRPILKVSKSEILSYVDENSLSYVTDSTNLSCDYSRNRIRHNVLPELEKLYEGYASNIERSVELLRRDAEYLTEMAGKAFDEVVENGALLTKKAQNLHPSILSRIVKMLYNHYGFSDITEAHITSVCGAIKSNNKNFTLSLHKCFAVCERGQMRFAKELCSSPTFCIPIKIGESVTLPSGITLTLSREKADGAYPIKASALGGALTVCSRTNGDTVTVFGKTHKIKRMIADKKLSASEKADLFFLKNDGTTVYSNLPATADFAFARKGDDTIYIITTKENLTHE